MIHLRCACGAELQVADIYAGGHILCHACGASVIVPTDSGPDERFRFHCPHCNTRVVARRSSAGKKSQCPACEKVYIVPEPPAELDSSPPEDSRRIELNTDDLALRFGLPFPVGKLEPPAAAAPQPRYLHSPFTQPEGAGDAADAGGSSSAGNSSATDPLRPGPSPPHNGPGANDAETTVFEGHLDKASRSAAREPRKDAEAEATVQMLERPADAGPANEWLPDGGLSSFLTAPSSVRTVAAVPQITQTTKPASVGELKVVNGACSGQRIRLDFRRFVVGAERDCDLRPESPLLSRHHCVFKKDEYSLRIRDLGSKDGTFVNGRRIFSEAILKPGDEVRIADVKFHVILPRGPDVVHSTPDSAPSISDFVIL